jgi:hypothetical protein
MAPGEIVPDPGQHAVQSPKLMRTIAWNSSGFHVVKALPKGSKFKAQDDTNNVLIAISEWRRLPGRVSPNKLSVHADNPRPHNAKVSTDFIALN